jgi:reactive intermediate/imine deaminase
MNHKQAIHTKQAPVPSGTYSQAIKVGTTIYLAGQIGSDPHSGELISSDPQAQAEQVFKNLAAVAEAAGGNLNNIVKLSVFLMDLSNFPVVNATMAKYFTEPYPARSTFAVAGLPKGALIEVEAIMVI